MIIPPHDASPEFGADIELSDNIVVVGDPGASTRGAVFVFKIDGIGGYTQLAKLQPPSEHSVSIFGRLVDISGDTILVGGSGLKSLFLFSRDASGICLHAHVQNPGHDDPVKR